MSSSSEIFIDSTLGRENANEEDFFYHGENEEYLKVLKAKTIQEKLDIRFSCPRDNIAIVSKENLLTLPFKGVPHHDYPSPWLTVPFGEFGDLVKATAYVIKKRFDLPPFSRVGLIANATPHYQLICFALWYNRCTIVSISPKLGNNIKQYWARMLDMKMFFYDSSLIINDNETQTILDDGGEWIWPWEYPLTEEEQGLCAGPKGIPMFSIYQKDFCEEIYQSKLEGKTFKRQGQENDIILITGTSSSSQAIIKNGHFSKMKFSPFNAHNFTQPYQNYMIHSNKKYISNFINIPFNFGMGNAMLNTTSITVGGPLIYHTQEINDVGFIPENLLNDLMETKVDRVLLFPFHYAEIKKLFDSNHPKCPEWKAFMKSRDPYTFRVSGSPLNESLAKWFRDEFNHIIVNEYGASEANLVMYSDVTSEILPGEENYFTRCPWYDFYLKPLNDNDQNIGELYCHSSFLISGYVRKAEKGEFYESPIPGFRIDIEADQLFTQINGKKFYKTNDIWIRSPKSGKYKYVSRVDEVLALATGLKMNPLPFEEAVTQECDEINRCCLLLDNTLYEVVCFVEPNWSEINLEDGRSVEDSLKPEEMSKEQIKNVRKIAQKQIWDKIFGILQDSSKNLNNWAKQFTINNIVVFDYGKKFPITPKGSIARRVIKLDYSYVLERISKLINGEIKEIGEEDEIVDNKNEQQQQQQQQQQQENNTSKSHEVSNDNEDKKDISPLKIAIPEKTQEEINEEIQNTIKIIYESIKEIIPSSPSFEDFKIRSPFNVYGIDSVATRKLTNILARKTKYSFSPATLFNYGTPLDLAKHITGHYNIFNNESIQRSLEELKMDEKIAIIGMALRLPGSINNTKSFWMALAKGRDCVLAPVKDRNLHTGYTNKPAHLLGPHEHNVPRCGCYDNRGGVPKPSKFDAEFFHCSPEEARCLDPRQRWILETSWEALENSGIPPDTLKDTITGVFVGINDDHDYQDLLKKNNITPPISTHSTPSGIAGRLSYFYKLFGPSFTIDTACSTGASALYSACLSLQHGDCDLSIVSGVKYMYSSDTFHETSIARMTSPNGRCATFDKDADGFAPSEGCVTFILKRYEDAIRDKDNILSVILGSSCGQSGIRQSISAPSPVGQILNLRKALQFAGVNPSDISYVEAHGTGTPFGDAIEVNALNKVYAGTHSTDNPLVIGSVKSNIGHTCEAAGLAGIAKVILAMKHKFIPKNLHFNSLNPEIDIDAIPIQIATKTIPWETKESKPRIAQVSSFGLQGSIVHVILQEYIPETKEKEKNKDSTEDHILTISAKTLAALLESCENYLNVLESMEDNKENIENFCFTSNVGRQHFDYRISVSGRNASELIEELEKKMGKLKRNTLLSNNDRSSRVITQNLEIYFEDINNTTVPKNIYETIENLCSTEKVFKETFDFCINEISDIDLYKIVEEKKESLEINERQTLLISFYYSLHYLNESLIIKDNGSKMIYGGFGLGEIIGLVNCGGLSLTSALTLIQTSCDKIPIWYEKQSLQKLRKSIYISSLNSELKNGYVLSLENIITIMKNINTCNDINSMITKYGPKSKNITIYCSTSTNSINKQKIIDEYPTVGFIDFFYDTDKLLYEKFIMNQYNNGLMINWKEYNKKIENNVHKIELPTYPFQRSTYWPFSL